MKNNYFDDEKQGKKAKPKKSKKKKSGKMTAGKWIVLIIALIVAAIASFLVTIKILVPDYDLTELLPEKAASFVKEDILKKETSTEPANEEETTIRAVPEKETLDYLEDAEFKFDSKKQGNFIGNLLNGGKVGNDKSYIYHIVDGKGIYRFAPSYEGYSCVYKTDHNLSSLNLRGDYFYFVDETTGKLQKLQKGTSKPKTIAENTKFVYVYNSLVYYITKDNVLCVMDVKALNPVTVYFSADSELNFVGISKERIFFTVDDGYELEFLSIDNFAKSAPCKFRENSTSKHETGFVMENGYLYYIKRDSEAENEFSVIRQKFGSKKTYELAKTKTNHGYPIADSNKLFYADYEDNKLVMKEFNMNSKKTKTMLKSDKLKGGIDESIGFFHGGEYDFIIGNGNYRASSNLTSSTNVMKFKDGKWKY